MLNCIVTLFSSFHHISQDLYNDSLKFLSVMPTVQAKTLGQFTHPHWTIHIDINHTLKKTKTTFNTFGTTAGEKKTSEKPQSCSVFLVKTQSSISQNMLHHLKLYDTEWVYNSMPQCTKVAYTSVHVMNSSALAQCNLNVRVWSLVALPDNLTKLHQLLFINLYMWVCIFAPVKDERVTVV